MRIIGGEHRGRKLVTPPNQGIRPTTDRMRETIFNILSHGRTTLRDSHVLDVFAGTGAMGLEALSRGAAQATFFDKDPQSLQLVKKNIALMKLENKTIVSCKLAPKFTPSKIRYNFIFLDPPYNLDVINDTLISLEENNYIADDCVIILEYSSLTPLKIPNNYELLNEKTYGDARFSIIQKIS